eukprot:UN28956
MQTPNNNEINIKINVPQNPYSYTIVDQSTVISYFTGPDYDLTVTSRNGTIGYTKTPKTPVNFNFPTLADSQSSTPRLCSPLEMISPMQSPCVTPRVSSSTSLRFSQSVPVCVGPREITLNPSNSEPVYVNNMVSPIQLMPFTPSTSAVTTPICTPNTVCTTQELHCSVSPTDSMIGYNVLSGCSSESSSMPKCFGVASNQRNRSRETSPTRRSSVRHNKVHTKKKSKRCIIPNPKGSRSKLNAETRQAVCELFSDCVVGDEELVRGQTVLYTPFKTTGALNLCLTLFKAYLAAGVRVKKASFPKASNKGFLSFIELQDENDVKKAQSIFADINNQSNNTLKICNIRPRYTDTEANLTSSDDLDDMST